MSAMNKALLTQGFEFATACYTAGINATPFTTWLSQQATHGITTTPIARTNLGTANGAGNFDQAVLAAVQSSPAGVGMNDLRPILAHYNRPPNQIGAALGRLQKKNLIAKKGNLWTPGTTRKRATTASAETTQQQAQTG